MYDDVMDINNSVERVQRKSTASATHKRQWVVTSSLILITEN